MELERLSHILIDEAICMEQMATRLERLLPAVRRGAVDEIARGAVGLRDFSGPVEAFHVASGNETAARLERARERLLEAVRESLAQPSDS